MEKPLILVVEDNAMLRQLIKLLADRFGVDADLVPNGRDALNALNSGRSYSLVLMDWLMPDMDGIECTRKIRAEEESAGGHIPIIAMTANADAEDRRICLENGMDDYMSKPFGQQEFRNVLERWIVPAKQAQGS